MTAVEELARRLTKTEKRLAAVESPAPQLAYSALEDGAFQEFKTVLGEDGEYRAALVGQYGMQYDGTHGAVALDGPPPPIPAALTMTSMPGGVLVKWEGDWALSVFEVAPHDFTMLEVHVSTSDVSGILFSTKRQEIVSARGGEVFVPVGPGVEVYCWGVARSRPGKASTPGPVTGPVAGGKVTEADLDIDLSDLGGTTIWYGDVDPTTVPENTVHANDLWLKYPERQAFRFAVDDLGNAAWEDQRDQGIVDALEEARQAAADAATAQGAAQQAGVDALAAHTAANTAQDAADDAGTAAATADAKAVAAQGDATKAINDAAAANSLASTAKTTADAKITVYRQSAAPTGGTYKINGDLWIDSDDGKLYVATTTSGNWALSDDQRIGQALTNAGTAQTTADKKTTVFAQTSAPTTAGRTLGDVWLDTDDSNKWYDWTGSAWTARTWGAGAIGATARQLGGITVFYQTSQPAAGMVSGDLWIDTDDGNKLYAYTTAWNVSQDVAIQTALTNAGTAQTTADKKIAVFAQTSAPSTTGRTVGDVWIDTDDGNRWYDWPTGATPAWTPRPFGQGAVAPVVGSNLLTNEALTRDSGTGGLAQSWTAYQAGTVGTVTRSVGTGGQRVQASAFAATGTNRVGIYQDNAIDPTLKRFKGSVKVYGTAPAGSTVYFYVEYRDAAGTVLGNQSATLAIASVPTTEPAAANVTFAPAAHAYTGAVTARLYLWIQGGTTAGAASITFHDAVFTYADAITVPPGSIGNISIQPQSLVASDVVALGTVTGALLKADAIDGKTITGATIQTANGAVQRLVLNSVDGLVGYGSDGTTVKTQVGTDGILRAVDAILSGTITAGAGASQGVRISKTAGVNGGGAIELWPTDLDNPGGTGQPGVLEAATEDGGLMARLKAPPRVTDGRFSSLLVRTADTAVGDGIVLDSTADIRLDANGGTANDIVATARNFNVNVPRQANGTPYGTIQLDGPVTFRNAASANLQPLMSNNGGTFGVLAGTAPPAGTPLIIKTYYANVALNANGDGTITWAGGAFPHGVLGMSIFHITPAGAPSNNLEFVPWGVSLSAVNVRGYLGTGIVASLSIGFTLVVVGW